MTNYEQIGDVLLKTNEPSIEDSNPVYTFVGDNEERLNAAKQLENGGMNALVIIREYFQFKGFMTQEPCPDIEKVLLPIYEKGMGEFKGLTVEQFLNTAAEHYLGRIPEKDETLPDDQYGKILNAFQLLKVPAQLYFGSIADFPLSKKHSENNLQKILDGYNWVMDTFGKKE